MFYVGGIGGLTFSGTLEELLETGRAGKIIKSQAIQSSTDSGSGLAGQPEGADAHASHRHASHRHAAAEAYRQTIRLHAQTEPLYHAYQIMKSPVLSVPPETPQGEAWRLMAGKGIRHLPVASPGSHPIGMISRNDFFKAWTPGGGSTPFPAAEGTAADMMSTPTISADAMTDIRRIAQGLFEHRIGCMPIIDPEGALIGIVTRSDILHALIQHPPLKMWG